MANVTVSLTDTEVKCLEYCVTTIQDWADNALISRARSAQEEIIVKLVAHCNENDIALAVGVDAQVTQAYELGVVDTLTNRAAAEEAARPEFGG